jgi:dipeptidyl-peptidase-3
MNKLLIMLITGTLFTACTSKNAPVNNQNIDFNYLLEQFSDIKIMRYQVPGFDELSVKEKELIYYLSEAALCGRDIIFDQNYKYNLVIRRTNEAILTSYSGDKESNEFKNFEVYAKRVWFSNGIHHHYSTDKFMPEVSAEYFSYLINETDTTLLPLAEGEDVEQFTKNIIPIIFDADRDAKK